MISSSVQWLARLTAVQEIPSSIPGYTLEIFLEVWGPPSLVRTIGQLLDVRSSEIRLRKLKLRLRDKRFANHKGSCTAIYQQPLQSVLALRGYSAMDLFYSTRTCGLFAHQQTQLCRLSSVQLKLCLIGPNNLPYESLILLHHVSKSLTVLYYPIRIIFI